MIPFNDIPTALTRIGGFMLDDGAGIPAEARSAIGLSAAHISPVDRIVNFGKAIHTHRESLGEAAKTIGAEAIEFAGRQGWHGMDSTSAELIADLIGVPE